MSDNDVQDVDELPISTDPLIAAALQEAGADPWLDSAEVQAALVPEGAVPASEEAQAPEAVEEPAEASPEPAEPGADVEGAAKELTKDLEKPEGEASPEPVPKAKDDFDKRFEALARQDQEVRQAREQLKSEKKAMVEQLREELAVEFQARQADLDRRLAEDPMAALREKGWSLESLTAKALDSRGPVPPEVHQAKLAKRLEVVEAELTKERQQRMDAQAEAQREVAEGKLLGGAKEALKDDDKYLLLNTFLENPAQAVYDHIVYTHKVEKRVLQPAEAADRLESYWRERLAHAQTDKLQLLLSPTTQPDATKQSASTKPAKAAKTLKNSMSTGAESLSEDELADMDDDRLLKLALRKLR
jgi:hypothetical protein